MSGVYTCTVYLYSLLLFAYFQRSSIVHALSLPSKGAEIGEKLHSPFSADLSARFTLYSYISSVACSDDDYRILNWDNNYARYLGPCEDVKVFRSDGDLAFVSYDGMLNAVVVTFRGSQNPDNWMTNFNLLFRQYHHSKTGARVPAAMIHSGFYVSIREIQDDIRDYVKALLKKRGPSTRLAVTGHSLGGAQASLSALDFVEHGIPVDELYTFGMPRVGNAYFVAYFEKVMTVNMKRVVVAKDQVPWLPFRTWGYAHIPGEVYVKDKNVVVCDDAVGKESIKGNIQHPWFLCNWIVHVKYNTLLPSTPDPDKVPSPRRDTGLKCAL